ncbi:hypothetical protein C8R47DRAFT_780625 [Mycena vitilis]|nr:hypothetical protein C8R47DRAFT_780625 [Mycena vitilis]
MFSCPPPESLPPPVFDHDTPTMQRIVPKTNDCENLLPLSVKRIRHFDATLVSIPPESGVALQSNYCPCWSPWAASQFAFDYLFMLITLSDDPELFKEQYHEQYMDAIYKLHSVVLSMGKMPDGSPPPSLFQSFYHLKRLFPNGLVPAQDFIGEVGITILLRVFALGILMADQAIYEQRNRNLNWQHMCDIPDSHVHAFETAGLYALNGPGNVFDLAENRTMYLDWLGHLMYHAEFYHFRTSHVYLRNSANLIAFAHAQAFLLPRSRQRNHFYPVHLPSLETLSIMLCWNTTATPLPPQVIQYSNYEPSSRGRIARPTAADVLATVAAECTSRLLYPLRTSTFHYWVNSSSM